MGNITRYTIIDSPLGEVLLTSQGGRLCGLYFADAAHSPRVAADWIRDDAAAIFEETRAQLGDYAAGKRRDLGTLRVEISGTAFQMRVWREIARIPYGRTVTYGQIAERMGAPRAVRAVGTAAGRNPLCWIVPCHRVGGQEGRLTGYAGGLHRKRLLLEFEAARSRGETAVLGEEIDLASAL